MTAEPAIRFIFCNSDSILGFTFLNV